MAPSALILVDSSVWVDYYRPGQGLALQEKVKGWIYDDRVATAAVIMIEILRGCQTKAHAEALREDFLSFHQLPLTADVARRAADMGFTLDRKGIVIPTIDLVIAASAIERGCFLAHQDKHFAMIAQHFPLHQEL